MKQSSGSQIASQIPEPNPDELAKKSLEKIKQKFIVMSGKGGVGKTSVSVNLAIALANKGYTVGLLDVDIHGPDVPRMLGLNGMLSADCDQKMIPMRYGDNLKVVSMESLMPNKDEAIIVTTPQEVALADIRKSISFYKNVNMQIFGIIENMSGFTCPHCEKARDS